MKQISECSMAEPLISLTTESADNKSKYVKSLISLPTPQVETYDFGKDFSNRMQPRILLTADIVCGQYASKLGNRLIVPTNVLNGFRKKTNHNRTLPFAITYGNKDEDLFSIKVPVGYHVENLPKNTVINTEFGTYQTEYAYNEDTKEIRISHTMTKNEGTYDKEKYGEYCDFINSIKELHDKVIMLVKD